MAGVAPVVASAAAAATAAAFPKPRVVAAGPRLRAGGVRRGAEAGDRLACRAGGRELSYSRPHISGSGGGGQAGERQGQTLPQLLDSFWRARGVLDQKLRERLVQTGLEGISQRGGEAAAAGDDSDSWVVQTQGGSSQVAAVGRRLAELVELLGGGRGYADIDVAWMVVREPGLLTVDLSRLRALLLQMKVADGCEGVDVAKICEAQPALLLQDVSNLDGQESFARRMKAWQHGFVTDSDAEWSRNYQQLQEYLRLNGDAHVGCREGDNRDLARWAKKQRSAFKAGDLGAERLQALQDLQFEFSIDDAEWKRWYGELATFFLIYGHSSPVPLSDLTNYYLINWCCVQRIAFRNGVMPEYRVAMLDGLQFDWSGADPLS